jgi:hypothetical protein
MASRSVNGLIFALGCIWKMAGVKRVVDQLDLELGGD